MNRRSIPLRDLDLAINQRYSDVSSQPSRSSDTANLIGTLEKRPKAENGFHRARQFRYMPSRRILKIYLRTNPRRRVPTTIMRLYTIVFFRKHPKFPNPSCTLTPCRCLRREHSYTTWVVNKRQPPSEEFKQWYCLLLRVTCRYLSISVRDVGKGGGGGGGARLLQHPLPHNFSNSRGKKKSNIQPPPHPKNKTGPVRLYVYDNSLFSNKKENPSKNRIACWYCYVSVGTGLRLQPSETEWLHSCHTSPFRQSSSY